MKESPILPRGQQEFDSYQARLRLNVERELQALRTKVLLLFQGRLAGRYSATAAPTGGKYQQGDIVWNSNPTVAGALLAQYVIIGWICTVTGDPGTWVEMRTLTGT